MVGGAIGLAVILLVMQGPVLGQQGQPAPQGQGGGRGGGRGGGGRGNQPPQPARASAPYDMTGNWVSIITNNWRNRMVPPPRGGNADIPLNNAGTQAADAWDPAKDEAEGAECRYYGAASLMFQPTRLRISWQDDNILRMDTDAGTQTRMFRFATAASAGATTATPQATAAPAGGRTWQGASAAAWESRRPVGRGGGGGGGGGAAAAVNNAARYLKVTTTSMRPGYLRKNGVPYGERATLTEYFDVFREPDGTTMMVVTIAVDDPEFLNQPYIVIAHFKKELDGSKWEPSPCSARW